MYPFLITYQLGGITLEIGPYHLFLLLAVLTVSIGSVLYAIRRGFPPRTTLIILSTLFLSSLIGARLLNVLTHPTLYLDNPEKIVTLSPTGFSFYGGALLAVLVGYVVCRMMNVNLLRFADTLMPMLGIGIAIFRIGCLCRGCCFGIETDLPWGITFPLLSPAHIHQIGETGNLFFVHPVHPTQIYEMIAAVLLSIIAFSLMISKQKDGTALIVFASGFTAFRMFNDTLRVEPDSFAMPPVFYTLLYIGCLLICAYFLYTKLLGKKLFRAPISPGQKTMRPDSSLP